MSLPCILTQHSPNIKQITYSSFNFQLPQHQASKRLQAQLDAVTGAGSSKDTFTPTPSGGATAPNKTTASAAKSKPNKPGTAAHGPPETEAAKQARLRRACERKPSGRLKVPESVHEKWRTGSRADRDELMDVLASCNWDQDL